ncbi:hypothetical protein VE01_09587 [Pseudogymnoascus verrucosus]|uniref:Uncharacterized protein n=1 Tax=Pseudogymnoascus verrucosus TaxID=342668 RepID=A0A1B8G9E5_9PEZI|nr:uncharacterized protein VE01_09587 [Pseudogymnoascus verrucosus]OBT92445.1 hypothetical protein VE01_09587 [Pseudogymnoascus verrucosus]
MAPGRISPRAAQEPWDTEEQWENDGEHDEEYDEYDGEHDEEYDEEYDGEYDAELDSNGDATDGDDATDGEWDLKSADAEEASALASEELEAEEPQTQEPQEPETQEPETQEPETHEPETQEPETQGPALVSTEEAPGNPGTLLADGEASLPNKEDSVPNLDSFDADKTLEQAHQKAENEPVDPQVPQEEKSKLTPEEQAMKDREAWQLAVADRKERLREGQMAKNDRARKLFDIFQKDRKEEKLKTPKKVVDVKSGRYKSRINNRGIVGELGKKVAGKVVDAVAEKLAEKLASKKAGAEKENKGEISDKKPGEEVLTASGPSNNFVDQTFMDNLMKAIEGPNLPVMDGLPGVTSYDEDAPSSPEDPRRIHRVLKVVLGSDLFEELSELSLHDYEAQEQAARKELVNKVVFAVRENPATEKIKIELLEGLPGLGDCGLPLPLRKPVANAVDPCELAELCAPDILCPAADLCREANAHRPDNDITPTSTARDIASDGAERKVSPMLTLLRLFRAARLSPGSPKEPQQKTYEGFRGIGKRDVGEFEAYMADLNNACSFNMREVRKEVVGAPRKLSPNFKTVEHTITVAGATSKPLGDDEKEEGASLESEEDEEGAKDDSDTENEEGAEDESGEENEDMPASEKSTARHGNHNGWFPSIVYRRSIEPAQDGVPAVADSPSVPAAILAPIEPVVPSPFSENAVDDLIAETIAVASLGPARPPFTTPESVFGTTQSATTTPTGGITGESEPITTEANSGATDPTIAGTTPAKKKEMAYKAVKPKPTQTMSKEAASWEKKQRQRARRIRKEREARARALRRIKFAKKLEEERARKAVDRAAFLEEIGYQPPTLPQYSKRAPPSPLEAHAPTWTGHGVKEEEQRWRAGEGGVSAADREEAAREIAKVAKLREAERQKGVEDAATRASVAAPDDGVGNPYLDHKSYFPAQAHVDEATGVRFPYKGVGDAAPELGNVGVVVTILVWIVLIVAILRCQRRRRVGSPDWERERRGRGFLRQGRKKRQSEEQDREKLDV